MELIEIAPGIDLERDILAHMDFLPAISPPARLMMDAALFHPEGMDLRERLLATPLAERFELDTEHRFCSSILRDWRLTCRRTSPQSEPT